jgi:hypothetical protein
MDYPNYDLHSWSKQYREEFHREAMVRHRTHLSKAHRTLRSEEQRRWFWLGKLAAAVRLS